MAAYWMVRIDVRDVAAYDDYRKVAPEVIAAHGGRFLARGGRCESPEGRPWSRNVIIEFPDYGRALACYRCAEYQAALVLRRRAADAEVCIVEGA